MRLENWLAGLRRACSLDTLAPRRVQRRSVRWGEPLETRLVLANPTVSSIIPDPTQPGANVDAPRFVVTFSEAVTGVSPADFVAVPGAGVTVAPGPVVVTGSGTTYTVTVNGVSGTGTLGLNLVDDSSIRDGSGLPLAGNGDGTFQAAQNFATGSKPASLGVGDFNGDGLPDLAVANFQSDSAGVLLGNGNGTFETIQTFATGSRPRALAVADVNGDMKLDLVASNRTTNTVSVLLGNGNGTFQARQDFGVGSSPYGVAVGDVSGDGVMDLVATSLLGDTVSVLLGNGTGTFQAAQNFATGDAPVSVVLGDVNGDMALDLATANLNTSTVSVLLGNGNGTFQAPLSFAAGGTAYSLAAGDVNGDGRLDLAVTNRGGASVGVLLGNGNGTFQAVQSFATGSSPRSVSVRDVNGDGRLDLVTGNYASNTASVLLGNGNGTFQSAQNFATGSRPFSVSVGDVNGDGRPDLAVANYVSNTVSVLLNAANGNFTGQTRAVDTIAPRVVSIVADPTQPGANVASPRFIVTFSESVTGVSPADFVAVPGAGVTVAPGPVVVTGSGTTYTVTVNGVSGTGTLGLNLVDDSSIRDGGANRLAGNGDGTFQAAQNFATGTFPYSVAVGDVNGDGRLDLAVANRGSNTVSVLLGNGNGTFQAAQNFSTGLYPRSVVVGDVNGDGRPDLAVANRGSNTVSVLLGNGDGTFQAAQNFATGPSLQYSVALGDVNGDGRLDLAVAKNGNSSLSVLLGNGNGTFQAAQNFVTGTNPFSVAVGDVNGDMRLDLAVANRGSDTVSLLLGNGNGTFQAAQNFATGDNPVSVSVGDVNGDGRLDLAVANRVSNTVSVLLGNGDGTFQNAQNFATGARPFSVTIGDVNGDGRLDLAAANYSSSTVSVLLGNGNGTFQPAQNFATGANPYSVSMGDVNGDGRLDLAVANSNGNSVSVLLNAANGNFTGQTRAVDTIAPRVVSIVADPTQPGANVANPRFVVTFSESVTGVDPADFAAVPGAGVTVAPGPVVVTGSGTTYTVTVNGVSGTGTLGLNLVDDNSIGDGGGNHLVGNGDGTFQASQNFATGDVPLSVAVGDLNGDGRLDLAVANFQSNTVGVLLGNGNGTFQASQNFTTGTRPRFVSVADLNGDGRTDLAVAADYSYAVSVLLGNGNGTFQTAQDFATGRSPSSVSVGDLNGDGRLDLVASNVSSGTVSVLLGNGNGTFQPAQNFSVGDFPRSVTVGDVNGDGRLDLAAINSNSGTASVLLGNGDGTFQAAQNFTTGAQPTSVAVGDFNSDGRLDLAVTNLNSDTVSVLLGNGNGTFQAAQNFGTGIQPLSMSLGDVNGDGRLDLAVANFASDTVSVLLGNGNGTFQAAQNFAAGTQPDSVAVGDVNGDGRLDLVVANQNSNSVSVLLNAANGNFTGQTRAVDTVAPTVTSVLRQDPLAAVTGADQLTFRVTFDEAVQNVSTGDFILGGTSAADGLIFSVTPVSTSVYDVVITGVTNSNGTIQLLFAAGQDITDLATNALTNTTPTISETYTLVNNRAPTALALGNTSIAENVANGTGIGTFTSTDPDTGNTFTYTLVTGTGSTDNGSFRIVGDQLQTNAALNFETKSSYSIRIRTTDQGGLSFEQTFTITVTNVNEAPTAVALQNTTTTLPENTSTVSAIKLADIVVTDDALGTNTLSLTGADAAFFEIVGTELRLKSGTVLNFEAKASYSVTVNVNDAAVGATPDASTNFTLTVTNVNEAPTAVALQNTTTSLPENTSTASAIKLADIVVTDDALGTNTLSLSGADAAVFEIVGTALRLKAGTVLNFEAKSSYSVTVNVNDATVGATPDASTNFTLSVTNTNDAPVLNNSGSPFVVLGVGARQSLTMRSGVLVSELLARGAGGDPISDQDAAALEGIALTAIDRTFGTFQYTLVSSSPSESDWIDVEAAGAITATSALLLPTNARLRFKTTLVPHHEAAPQFLALESKLDAGLTFRAWDRTSGAAGGRASTTTNGGSTAFSTAVETSRVYFEARLWRHYNRVAGLNVDTLEAEFTEVQRLANINNPDAFEDRSTDAFTGFSVLMSAVPELSTIPVYRLYFGVQFNEDGTETDMGYRYLTTNLAEAEELEGKGPADKRATREGAYFREWGINSGTGIIGYIFATQLPGTSAVTQIYRTDLVDKPTRPAGTTEGSTPTSFRPQESGDHVYTTNIPFESARTGVWRIESPRGFARELSPNTSAAAATAGATASPVARAASVIDVGSMTSSFNSGVTGSIVTAIVPTSPVTTSAELNAEHVSTTVDVGLIASAVPTPQPLPANAAANPETTEPIPQVTSELTDVISATDDLFTSLGSTADDLCPW